jgi:energy-converting hydrogenase Eha subunit F
MYHLGLIPTNDNNNSKFLAVVILVGFDKLYPKKYSIDKLYPKSIPYTPMRDLISHQRGVMENSNL